MPESATLEAPVTITPPSESMTDLDNLFGGAPEPAAQTPPPTPAPTAPAPIAAEPAKPAATTTPDIDDIPRRQPKPVTQEPTKPATKPAVTNGEDPTTLKQFRERYETTKKERDDYQKKLADFEKAREDGTRKEVEKARAELSAEVKRHQSRADELETQVKFLDYSRSSEFKEKYHEPLKRAWQGAIDDLKGTTITLDDGTTREATADDVLHLTRMDPGPARAHAKEMFGDAAPEIMAHRKAIVELQKSRDAALEEWRTKGSERDAEQARTSQEHRSRAVQMWEGGIKELAEGNRDLFGDDEKDVEGNELLKKGDAIVRLAFTGEGLKEGLTPEQRAEVVTRAQASVAARARAFGRQVKRTIQLQDENDSLRAKLAAYEKSEPVNGAVKKDGDEGQTHARPEDAIDSM